MIIDNVINVQHFQQALNYPFVISDCLFDSMSFLFHYSQTSPQLHSQCVAHFAQSFQQPTIAFQEIINIDLMFFNYRNIMASIPCKPMWTRWR